MPIRTRYDEALGTFFVTIEGDVTEEELVRFAKETAPDPALPQGRRELIDLRKTSATGIPSRALRSVAEAFGAHDQFPERTRVAMVASEDWIFGLSRMYQAYRDESKLQLRVFRDMGEARRWLELPEE